MRSGSGGMVIVGKYRIIGADTIEFENSDYDPKEQCLPGPNYQTRCYRLRIPDRETDYFRFLNPNTLVIQSVVRGVPPIRYRRLQEDHGASRKRSRRTQESGHPPRAFAHGRDRLAFDPRTKRASEGG
jgi:hypothetical protein